MGNGWTHSLTPIPYSLTPYSLDNAGSIANT